MEDYIYLEPTLVYRMWGNKSLSRIFSNTDEVFGEAWVASAYKGYENKILGTDTNFREYFNKNREFFDNFSGDEYPLLSKLISTDDDLSIQIHPNDNVAKKINQLGKSECWYVLNETESYLYLGDDSSKDVLIDKIKENKIMDCLEKVEVKKGDFLYIPAKTIHAIGKNNLIFELQQSSDLTYRIYDYDRVDPKTGIERKLHISETIDVIKDECETEITTRKRIDDSLELLTENTHFTLYKISNHGTKSYTFSDCRWIQLFVTENEGELFGKKIKKYDSIIVNSKIKTLEISGNIELMVSYIKAR